MVDARLSVVMNLPMAGVRGAFALELDSDSNCTVTPRVLRLIVVATIPASCRRSCSTQLHKPCTSSQQFPACTMAAVTTDVNLDTTSLEQIVAEQERVQQHIVEQMVHVPIPQIQEQFVESIQSHPWGTSSVSGLRSRSRSQRLLQWPKTLRPNLVLCATPVPGSSTCHRAWRRLPSAH